MSVFSCHPHLSSGMGPRFHSAENKRHCVSKCKTVIIWTKPYSGDLRDIESLSQHTHTPPFLAFNLFSKWPDTRFLDFVSLSQFPHLCVSVFAIFHTATIPCNLTNAVHLFSHTRQSRKAPIMDHTGAKSITVEQIAILRGLNNSRVHWRTGRKH